MSRRRRVRTKSPSAMKGRTRYTGLDGKPRYTLLEKKKHNDRTLQFTNSPPKVDYFNRNTGDGEMIGKARVYAGQLSKGRLNQVGKPSAQHEAWRASVQDEAWRAGRLLKWNKDKMNAHAETVFDNARRRRQKKVENDKRWCNKKNTEKEREECELYTTVVGVGAGGAYGCASGGGPGCLLGSIVGGLGAGHGASFGSQYVYPDKKYGEPPATMTMERGGRRKKKTRRARRKLKRKTIKRRRRKRKTNKKR